VPLETRLEIVAQAAEGLAAAHGAGVIHRDIKPGNILVVPPSTISHQPSTKLTDFGIGQVVSAEYLAGVTATGLTQTILAGSTSTHAGTHAYTAPEVLMGRPASKQSDIYSLGVVLYQLAVGDFARPLTTDWPDQISDPLLREDLKRCFAGKPEERFADALELAKSLRALPERRAAAVQKESVRAVAAKEAFERGAARVASLAVLPFTNLSPDPENEYLSDGIAEDLLTALSRVPGLRVPGRTSCFVFKGKTDDLRKIGQALSVETVLEGSVRKAGNRLRITAQLINVADGFHLWSERYDREMADVFAVQDEITQAIVSALMPKLAAAQPAILVKPYSGNIEAYELCLRGRYHLQKVTPDGFAMAIRLFEEALERDPNHPLAYAGLAEVYVFLSYFGGVPPTQAMPKAKAAALRATELDDTLAEAHANLANVLYMYDWDWAGAEREFRRALELGPRSAEARMWHGLFLWARLRHEEALAQLQKAAELDPFSLHTIWLLSWPLLSLGRHDEALDLGRKMLAMDPGLWLGHATSAFAKWATGLRLEAIEHWEKAVAIERGPVTLGGLCWFCGRAGKLSEARQALEQLQQMAQQRYVQPFWLAWAYDALGDREQARAYIQRAIEEHDSTLVHLRGWRGWRGWSPALEDCLPLLEQVGL